MLRRKMAQTTKLLLARLVVIFLSASQRAAEATAIEVRGVELCPVNCSCSFEDRSLSVNCFDRTYVNSEQLFRQLDTLLSSNLTLTVLSVTDSPLTHVPRFVCRLKTLSQLHLDRNRLVRLPDNCFTNLIALESLTASRNYITELQDGLFDRLHHLERLVLSDNRISSIGLRVFNGSAMLTSLQYVDLHENRIHNLEPWFYNVGINVQANNRAQIDLHFNNISAFTNEMGWKAECSMRTSKFYLDLGRNNVRHISDILRGWNISSPLWMCLHKFGQRISYAHVSLYGNFLDCDCTDFDLLKIVHYSHSILLDGVYCNWPATLYNRRIISIPLNQLVCELTQQLSNRLPLCPSTSKRHSTRLLFQHKHHGLST